MSPDKRLDIQFKSFIRERMLAVLPADFPSLRELRIQNTKLQRLLADAGKGMDHFYGARHYLAGGSLSTTALKKLRKEVGEKDARVGEQERKVTATLERSLKEWLRQNKPSMTNAEFQKWRASFNQGIDAGIKTLKKQLTKKIIEKLATGEQ